MAESRYQITKLTGENYFNWKYKMEMLMKEKKVWKVINEPAPIPITDEWKELDEKALSTIGLHVEDDQIQHIRSSATAKHAWTALENFHQTKTSSSRVSIMRTIMRQRLEEGGNMETHISKMTELFQKLLASGDEIKPEFFICSTLLGSVPESYDGIVQALEAREDDELTTTVVKTKLIADYRRRIERQQDERESIALRIESSMTKDEVTCYFCKSKGHMKRDCTKYKEWLQKKKNEQKANVAKNESDEQFLFVTSATDGWIVDSGATCHIVGSREEFIEFDANHRENVYVANGNQVRAIGRGTVSVRFVNEDGNANTVRIVDVLYVPGIEGNLISVKRLTEKGYNVSFDERRCRIVKDQTQIAVADITGNLYKIRVANGAYAVENSPKDCFHKWHSTLGHRDVGVVKTLDSGKFVDGVKFGQCTDDCAKKLNCEVCLQGKMARLKFPQSSENRAKEKLQLIHSDVCGPMRTITPSGKRYVLTFIDDYSRHTIIYLLKEKSEVLAKFQEFVEVCKTTFNAKPKCIRTDGGGEYVNGAFIIYLKKEGIQYQRTCAYTPQQNGVAERKNRTLIEMARCMLIDAKIGTKYWGEAVMMANFVQNRLPAKDIDKTPLEGWTGLKPNLQNFKKFGSKCYVHVPDERRTKLEDKSIVATLVGYDLASKAYRCYVPSTEKVVISRDVRFVDKDSDWKTDHIRGVETIVEDSSEKQKVTEEENSEEDADSVEIDAELGGDHYELTDDDDDEIQDGAIESANGSNNVPTLRRSERSNKGRPPIRLIEEINMTAEELIEPKGYNEAIVSAQKHEWISAMKEEMDSLRNNDTWELVKLPGDRKAIGSKWVYKVKMDATGKIRQYKARLVAQGFSQKYGTDYDQVFAPVVRQSTFRILLAVAAKRHMKVIHLDAKTAFLNGKLDEIIYMKQPPGFVIEGQEDHVCLLRRSLYGLKQSARVWNRAIHHVLTEAKYVQSQNDPCLYKLSDDGVCFVLIYVDDLIVAGERDEELLRCEHALGSKFKIRNLGEVRNYLGLHVERVPNGKFMLNQTAYIRKIADDFGLTNAKPSNIPLELSYGRSSGSDLLPSNERYRRLVGCLLYVSVNTRPDISASVAILAQKVSLPNQEDWNELKRIVKYLKGTAELSLELGASDREQPLIGYADANWAENRIDRKSNSGYVFRLYDGTISWSCKRQTCVALSSTEAEFIALSDACKEAVWLRRIIADFDLKLNGPTTIFEDNQSCLELIKEEKMSGRSKHIDVKCHFVKDYVDKRIVKCTYCPTESMIADLLTKPLSAGRVQQLREKCGIV